MTLKLRKKLFNSITDIIHLNMSNDISIDEYRKILRKSNCFAKLHVLIDDLATKYEETIKEKDRKAENKESIIR